MLARKIAALSPSSKRILASFSAPESPTDRDAAALARRAELLATNARASAVQLLSIVLGLASLCTAIAAAEDVYATRSLEPLANPLGITPYNRGAKLATTILTLLMLPLLCFDYHLEYKLQQLQGHLLPQQTIWETNLPPWLALEAALLALHAPVGCYGLWSTINIAGVPVLYDADSLLSALMFWRLKAVCSYLMSKLSGFHSDRALLIACSIDVRMSPETSLRYLMRRFPVTITACMYVFLAVLLTYWMRVAERSICRADPPVGAGMCSGQLKDLESVYNSAWLILITSLTVGYGDLWPSSHLGRFVAIIAAILGICVVALLVNAVAGYSKLDEAEDRACELLELAERNASKKVCAEGLRRDAVRHWVGKWRRVWEQEKGGGPGAARAPALSDSAHHARFILPLIRSLARWKNHLRSWSEARRRKDTVFAIREDLRALRVRAFTLQRSCPLPSPLLTPAHPHCRCCPHFSAAVPCG